MQTQTIAPLFFLFLSLSFLNGTFAAAANKKSSFRDNPFAPRASLVRYWKKQVLNNQKTSPFLLSKASPLSAIDSAFYANLAAKKTLSTHLPAFCSSAKLFCSPDISTSLEKHTKDSNFTTYSSQQFQTYGGERTGGLDTFKTYNDGSISDGSFQRYSNNAHGHHDKFANYNPDSILTHQKFMSYGNGATGGTGEFISYTEHGNSPNELFTSYSDAATGRSHEFVSYAKRGISGDPNAAAFDSYGKNGNRVPNKFLSYGPDSNVIFSVFNNYGQTANGANDSFTSYSVSTNVPENHFTNYGRGGNSAVETFTTYSHNISSISNDTFQSYGTESNATKVNFANYAKDFIQASEAFSGYGKEATGQQIGFSTYGLSNNTFTDYTKKGVTFAKYANVTGKSGRLENKWVEPGKFFRESMLKQGTVMPMPDIGDKMPKRSFLPRTILSKLPFSTSEIDQLEEIFNAKDKGMESIILHALKECERDPSPGETKRCVGSGEDMIDFATSVLGGGVEVRTTENVSGSKKDIMIGSVRGINGGNVTKSVSCHQTLYPYLLFYCHSVPNVRVYEADILDPNSKTVINHRVAICHMDTSSWSQAHGAFMALGSGPGKIEVCHWIFENDMAWTIRDV